MRPIGDIMEPAGRAIAQYTIEGIDSKRQPIFNHAQMMEILKAHDEITELFRAASEALMLTGAQEFKVTFVSPKKHGGMCWLNFKKGKLEIPVEAHQVFRRIIFKATSAIPQGDFSKIIPQQFTDDLAKFILSLSSNCSKEIAGIGKLPTNENVFTGDVYKAYREGMKDFMKALEPIVPLIITPLETSGSPFQEAVQALVKQVLTFDLEQRQGFRQGHSDLLAHLRRVLELKVQEPQSEYKKQSLHFADALTYWIFDRVNISEELFKAFHSYLPTFHYMTMQGLDGLLLSVWEKLSEEKSLKGSFHVDCTDTHSAGSLIYKLWSSPQERSGGSKTTQFLRMSNGSYKTGDKVKVIPELVRFLELIEAEGKTLGYFNLMAAKNHRSESVLCTSLHELETAYGLKSTQVSTVDYNSDFMRARNDYADDVLYEYQDVDFYTGEFKKFLTAPRESNFSKWSTHINMDTQNPKMKGIVDQAHKHYFNDCGFMKDEDRAVFNLLVTMEIVDDVIDEHAFDYVIIACKATVDRGPTFYTLLYLKHLLKKVRNLDAMDNEKIISMLFINGLLFENRLPQKSRVDIFLKAASRLLKKGPMPKVRVKL